MVKISKARAKRVKDEIFKSPEQAAGEVMADQLVAQFDEFNGKNVARWDVEIESLLLKQKEIEVAALTKPKTYPTDIPKFNPSGASKSDLELFYKTKGEKGIDNDRYPYHDRWTRNSTAVHEAVQRDLLYHEKYLANPAFNVARLDNGLPVWEDNIIRWREFNHEGQRFVLNGKMDGVLIHNETGKKVGFEFKTKSNTLGQVGHYKMKEPAPYHVQQCVAYSLLFDIDDYVIYYESVAKPNWTAGAEAKIDTRGFYVHVDDLMREQLLDKFANVCRMVEADEMPEHEPDKCLFSPYKHLCGCAEVAAAKQAAKEAAE